jgi:hypothetical protein
VPDAEFQIRDLGIGITAETRSARDGGLAFPALQAGRYLLLGKWQGSLDGARTENLRT